MKKSKKLIGIVALVIVVAIQFWPVDRTNPPVSSDIQAPAQVKELFKSACYDCHSNETKWPWYGYIAPVSWLLAEDIEHARSHFNFSEWETIPADRRDRITHGIWEEVKDGEMPLPMYRLMHPDARLSEDQKNIIRDWSQSGL